MSDVNITVAGGALKKLKDMGDGTHAEAVTIVGGDGEYNTISASQTASVLGTTGATGDHLTGVLVVPATTSPGVVQVLDGTSGSPTETITVFPGGASSVADLKPFFIRLGLRSKNGPWAVTTGANVSVIAIGNFT